MYNELLTGLKSVDDALKSKWAQKINTLLSQCCEQTKTVSRTAKLWAQYFDQVNIMRLFVRAARTGNWELHIYCVEKMLPYFHAAAHLPYAKSAHLYLQQMRELPTKMSAKYFNLFVQKGFFHHTPY